MADDEEIVPNPKKTSTSWKPGQSGNPKGRASRAVEREYLDIMMATCTPERWAVICEKAVHDAEKGDKYAREWLSAHMIGEPKKVHEYLINENRAITIRVVWDQPREIEEGGPIGLLQEGEFVEEEE